MYIWALHDSTTRQAPRFLAVVYKFPSGDEIARFSSDSPDDCSLRRLSDLTIPARSFRIS